jgi:hypothetical protein
MHHPTGISHETDELERIERARYSLFGVLCLFFFITLQLATGNVLWSAAIASSAALLASGYYSARATTRDPAWAVVEAEARRDGGSPSKRKVWVANLLPGVIALASFGLWLGWGLTPR